MTITGLRWVPPAKPVDPQQGQVLLDMAAALMVTCLPACLLQGISRAAQVCWCHPDKDARIQCILCLRGRCDIRKSFHCSNECFRQHWQTHKELHEARRLNGEASRWMKEAPPMFALTSSHFWAPLWEQMTAWAAPEPLLHECLHLGFADCWGLFQQRLSLHAMCSAF